MVSDTSPTQRLSEPAYSYEQGVEFLKRKQLHAAIACFDSAIAIDPKNGDAHFNRGVALHELLRPKSAIESYNKAIAAKPEDAEAHFNRGLALQELGQLDAAILSYDKAIAIRPDYNKAYCNRGVALKGLKQLDAAIASYNKAIALKPDSAEAYCNRGVALKERRRLDTAITSFNKAIAINPSYAEAYFNRGIVLQELGFLESAVADYDHAIHFKPDYADAQWNKSTALLLSGNYEKGWKLYEWRWKKTNFPSPKRDFSKPVWLGDIPLRDKTILLHSEQGLGDTIQFCRYADLLSKQGARVILEAPSILASLLETLEGVSRVVTKGSPLPSFDYHTPLMSLPLAFGTNLDSIPSPQRYLKSNVEKSAYWSRRLGEKTKPRIGLVWSSASPFTGDSSRSIALSQFMKILPKENCEFICLQKEINDIDKELLESLTNINFFGNELNDFSDTAALIDCVDLVVSTCTSVPHLSCALGKPTWIMLSYAPDWRWLLEKTDSPWYHSARLYRQKSPGDWQSVIESVKNDLLDFCTAR